MKIIQIQELTHDNIKTHINEKRTTNGSTYGANKTLNQTPYKERQTGGITVF